MVIRWYCLHLLLHFYLLLHRSPCLLHACVAAKRFKSKSMFQKFAKYLESATSSSLSTPFEVDIYTIRACNVTVFFSPHFCKVLLFYRLELVELRYRLASWITMLNGQLCYWKLFRPWYNNSNNAIAPSLNFCIP